MLATPFLSVNVNSSGERGLLGIAFDPNFSSNQFVYVYYTTAASPIHNRVSRFTANGDIGTSESVILELDDLSTATNHNGGALHFGDDGKLYIAVGENATPSNAQTLSNLHGKILRINSDGSIPADNPFFNTATGKNQAIWALGLRNPFTFAFEPQQPLQRMFVNDVGQNTFEEINVGSAGANYGWPDSEGPTTTPGHTGPIYFYGHGGGACAITGGAFYNPVVNEFPADYLNDYFFADYCAGWIKRRDNNGTITDFTSGISFPVDLQVTPDGSLYYLARGNGGQVFRIDYTANQAPNITDQPDDLSVALGQSATFSVTATGNPAPTYQWQRNRVNIPGATNPSFTIPAASADDHNDLFRVVVSNSLGTAFSREALLTVTGNSPPTATITQPAAGTLYT
ncbi:MAG: PQQ-dependent sugar dehydrogenase, partial [Vicinamibacterales bacterium]